MGFQRIIPKIMGFYLLHRLGVHFMFTSSQIADRIKQAAHTRGVLVKDLLVDCNLSKNTLSTMKSGGSFPRIEALVAIADKLDCSVDYLLGRTDDPVLHQLDSSSSSPI